MAISIQQHNQTIASMVVATYDEKIPVLSGFNQFFPRKTSPTRHVDVRVRRGTDFIAVDIQMFGEGNRNKRSKMSVKKYQPPFYEEVYDFNKDDVFANTAAMGVLENPNVNEVIALNAKEAIDDNKDMIERAINLQQAQVLQTGIVILKNGDNVDFGRKAESMVDLGASGYWDVSGSDPLANFSTAGTFLRDKGRCRGNTLNVIMRTDAFNALMANENAQWVKLLDKRRINRAEISMPKMESNGMAYHGRIAAGDFILLLWTYNDSYTEKDTGNQKFYLQRENVIIIPEDFEGKTVFGGLPYGREVTINGMKMMAPGIKKGQYNLRSHWDTRNLTSEIILNSAPLAVPVTIDKSFTFQVLASS